MLNKYTIIIFFLYIIFILISQLTSIDHFDEREFHLPTVKLFYEKGIFNSINDENYKSASTPLPYIIGAEFHKVLGLEPTIKSLRFINYIISFLTIIVFIQILRLNKSNYIFAILLLFQPYFLKPSFAYFMSIYGLFFYFLFIYFIISDNTKNYFLAGLSLTFAVLSQQIYLIVIPFFYIYYFTQNKERKNYQAIILDLISFSFPFIFVILNFYSWGGLTHKNFRYHKLEFHLEYLTAIFIVIGGIFLPYISKLRREHNYLIYVVIFIVVVLQVIFAYPEWSNVPKTGAISGLIFHSINIIENHNVLVAYIIKMILGFIGLSIIYKLLRSYHNENYSKFFIFLFVGFLIGFIINNPPSERHMLPLIATTFLLICLDPPYKLFLKLWILYQVIIGSIYFYYIMFLYSNQG